MLNALANLTEKYAGDRDANSSSNIERIFTSFIKILDGYFFYFITVFAVAIWV